MTLNLDARAAARANRVSRSHAGIAGAMFSAIATMLANARPAPESRRHRSRGSPPVPVQLRRDLGLMPEVLEPRSHWDYR